MKLTFKKGSTSNILHIFISDSSKTDGSGLTGLTYNSAGLTAYYIRPGDTAPTSITLTDITTLGTYVSGGFKEVDATNMPGVYEFHPPDACFASGADSCLIFLKGATNMAPLPIEIQLIDNTNKDIYDRIGAPVGASISADIQTIDSNVDTLITRVPAEVAQKQHLVSGAGNITPPADTGIWDILDAAISTRSSHSASDVWSVTTRTITGGTIDTNNDKTGYALSSSGVQDIWDALTSNLTTVGSIGKLLVDNVDAAISTRSSHSASDVWTVATRTITGGTIDTNNDKTGYSLSADQSSVTIGTVNALGTQAKADVNTEVDTALQDIDLDHLVKVSYGTSKPAVGSLFDLIMNKDNLQTFDQTTDSLEAIAEAGAGTGPSAAVIADAVWDEAVSDHTTAGSFGSNVQKHLKLLNTLLAKMMLLE